MDDDKATGRGAESAVLLDRCAKLAEKSLEARLQALFEAVDDTLFDLAERADSNALQTQYFDGMREVRKQRSVAERTFKDELRRQFAALRSGAPPETGESATAADTRMSLVEDRELEEELAISEMIAKGQNRLAKPLFALNQRFGALLRTAPPADDRNPLGPAGVARSFRQAVKNLEVETPVLILVYKLFEKHVIGELGAVYSRVNDELIGHGILPRLRAASRPAAPVTAAPPPTPPAQPADDLAADAGEGDMRLQTQVLATILELLALRRSAAPPADDVVPLGTADLLNALHLLQAEPTATAAPMARRQAIKGIVLDQAAKLTDQPAATPDASDEDSIDLVGMLFDYILQDRNLPDAMQVLLSRLQIPFIKAALLDRRLFASRSHPARRLLDALAEASVGWSRESDRGQKLYKKVSEVVEAVLREFDDDVTTFERLLADFEDFVTKTKRRAEVAEKRTTEATKGRERLQRARRRAAQEISARIDQAELPKLIDEILRKPWANALVLIHVRHGEDSVEFRDGLQFVDDLIWTAQPKTTAADVARLQSTLPHLAKRLRAGLAMVAYQDEDIARVFKGLKQLYRSMIDSQYREHLTMPGLATKPKPAAAPEPVVPVSLPVNLGGDGDVVTAVQDEKGAPASAPVDAARLQWVKDLEVGTWFEFRDEAGNTVRAKLSWKSPITSKFLLVDQKGLKVADKPVEELAQEIVSGDTVVLEAVPLFQRALGAIAERLRDEKTAGQGATDRADGGGERESPAKGAG